MHSRIYFTAGFIYQVHPASLEEKPAPAPLRCGLGEDLTQNKGGEERKSEEQWELVRARCEENKIWTNHEMLPARSFSSLLRREQPHVRAALILASTTQQQTLQENLSGLGKRDCKPPCPSLTPGPGSPAHSKAAE